MCYTSCMAPQINTGDFDGMVISMNFSEHNPPHFHVDFQGQKVVVDIREGAITKGSLPRRQALALLAWVEQHRETLMWNWDHPEAMKKIPSPIWK